MLKKIWRDEVVPLIKSPLFTGGFVGYLVLAYGAYLVNPVWAKDGMWANVATPATISLFSEAGSFRFVKGAVHHVVAFHGTSNYVSGLWGVALWSLASILFVSTINFIAGKRNVCFSLAFCVCAMTSAWNPEIIVYPNLFADIGTGAFFSVLAALWMFEYSQQPSWHRIALTGIWTLLAVSTFEPFLPYTGCLFLLLLLWAAHSRGIELLTKACFCRYLVIAAVVIGAFLTRILICLVIRAPGVVFHGHSLVGSGQDTGTSWGGSPLAETAFTLIKHLVREFVYRAPVSFPAFWTTLSLILFVVLVAVWAVRQKRLAIFICGVAVVATLFLIPITQGRVVGVRVFVPANALFLAFLLYCGSSYPRLRWWHYAVVHLFLFIFVTNLTAALRDITLRYEFDRHHALMMLHDLGQVVGQAEKPVVFVGRIFADVGPKDRLGVVYPMQRVYAPFGVEHYQEKLYVTGGGAGQATLLAPIQPERRTEFYRFLYLLGGFNIKEPSEGMERRAQDYVLAHKTPIYPNRGYIAETEDMVVVNLGIPVSFRDAYPAEGSR